MTASNSTQNESSSVRNTTQENDVQESNSEIVVLSDEDTLSVDSSDNARSNHSSNQGGTGVARATNDNLFDFSSDENNDSSVENHEAADEDIPGGTTYERIYCHYLVTEPKIRHF